MAKIIEAEARITAVDATGPILDNVAAKFNKLSGVLGAVEGGARKFGGAGVQAMNNVGAATDKVHESINRLVATLASGFVLHKIEQLGKESYLAFAKLDDIRRMQAATAGAAAAPPAFIEQQERLGRGTRFTMEDVGKAQLAVQQAGLAVADAVRIVEGAADYAVAMDTSDLAQVTKHALEAAEGLKEVGQESPAAFERLKDQMVKLHQLSGMSEEAIAAAYAATGPTVAATGLSAAAFDAMMTMVSRTGADPGEILRMFLTKLQAPGKEGIEALGAMGIDYKKFTTEGTLTPDSFKAFMHRHEMKVTERKPGVLAALLAKVQSEQDFVDMVVGAAGESFKDKKGELIPGKIKQLAKDAKEYYAENIAKVDVTGLIEAIQAAHPTLGQIEPLLGTRRAARALPFLTDQKAYEEVKAQFEHIPEGLAAVAAAKMEGGAGGADRRLWAAIEALKARSGENLAPAVTPAANATTKWLNSLTNQGTMAVDAGAATLAALSAWEVVAGLARSSAMALLPFKAAGAALGPWGAATMPLMLGGDVPEFAKGGVPSWGEEASSLAGLGRTTPPHFGIEDVRSATGAAQAVAKVEGSADLNVNVQVEPSDSFVSRIISAIRNEINVFGGSVGTAGSTGLSMPEAVPGP
jgi:hypothetical protein